jgi:ribonuclease Z
MHMDHFIGFDRLLRINVGREKRITLVGPAGIAASVGHKLQAYSWDLVERYAADLIFDVIEVRAKDDLDSTRFRFKARFEREPGELPRWQPGPALHWPDFSLHIAILEHHGPSLCFAVQEPIHVNVWRTRLDERRLAPGRWLQTLKRAIHAGAPDDVMIPLPDGRPAPLRTLRDLVSTERGQKIAYVTDAADTPANREAIITLAGDADQLFIEASFSAVDRDQAAQRAHLTTTAAGELSHAARARRVEPFHFSPRYEGEGDRMISEVMAAFRSELPRLTRAVCGVNSF